MADQVYQDQEGNIFSSIPNNADGDCLFESLAYFELDNKTKESICKKSTELRNQLCDAYKEILYHLYGERSGRIKTEKYKKKYSYAYEVINEYHDLIGKKQKKLDDLEKGILKTLFDGKVLHVDNVCNPKQWGSDMDILVLSALLKKHIRMYRVADNSRLLDPTDFPSADFFEDNQKLEPKDYIEWPTIHILFRNINDDTTKDGNHFEALVKVTTDNIEEERLNEALIEQLVNENYIDKGDSFEGADIDPEVINNIQQQLVDKHKNEAEINSSVVVDNNNFAKLQKKADTKKKEEKETKEKKKGRENERKETKEKKETKKETKKKKNKTQKKPSPSLKDKQVKTASPKEKTNTTLKQEEVKTATSKEKTNTTLKKEEEVKTASPKEEEITKILNNLLPKETTPKNNTRKKTAQTVVNESPKEREKLAIEMTLQDNYLEKPKMIIIDPLPENKIKKIKYKNGDVYIGEVKNNKKHGKGKYIFANGQTYIGEYRNGMRI